MPFRKFKSDKSADTKVVGKEARNKLYNDEVVDKVTSLLTSKVVQFTSCSTVYNLDSVNVIKLL